jgi:hypothetical protein
MAAKTRHDWTKLDLLIDNLKAQGWNDTQIAKDLGIGRQTLVDHLRSRESAHPSTPESTDITEVHQSTPEHQGTLEGYQEVMEDVQPSVPEMPQISTSEHQSAPQQLDVPEEEHLSTPESTDMIEVHPSLPEQQGTLEGYQEVIEDVQHSVPEMRRLITDEEYPSTPEVHPEMSPDDSTTAHSGVPARQDQRISTPTVHPGTPTEEDWELWTTIKARWLEVEKMLADWQALLSTPVGTPGHTQKKTYVFDVRHIGLIDRYAQDHRLDLKEVLYQALEEFFQRRGYVEG